MADDYIKHVGLPYTYSIYYLVINSNVVFI